MVDGPLNTKDPWIRRTRPRENAEAYRDTWKDSREENERRLDISKKEIRKKQSRYESSFAIRSEYSVSKS